MNIDHEAISELFRLHDIEGLISSGAPDDEYDSEVERIVTALEDLPCEQVSVTAVAEIFATVWAQMFELSEEQIRRRRFDFDEIAEKVMGIFA